MFLLRPVAHRALHSFPTRRSSDLQMYVAQQKRITQIEEAIHRFEMDAKIYESERAAKQRSEEHTSELQSPCNLVCRLLLEKKTEYEVALNEEARSAEGKI